MIRKILLLVLVFATVSGIRIDAQTLETFKRQLATPSISQTGVEARVSVVESADVAPILAQVALQQPRIRFRGYRVCIFFDNGQDARAGAVAARDLFEETYAGIPVYMVYENPYFKVSVGNCLTAEEAVILKGRVSGTFPRAFLKNEELTTTDLLPQ